MESSTVSSTVGFTTQINRLRTRLAQWGWNRDEIAAALAAEFRLRPRAAYRYATGFSGQQASDAYNARFGTSCSPTPMSKSRVSEFENWPIGRNTRRPSLDVLDHLADLYGTNARRLVDHHDFAAYSAAERRVLGTPQPQPNRESDPPSDAFPSPYFPSCTASERRGIRVEVPWVMLGDWSVTAERSLMMAAAHHAGEHADAAGSGNVDEATLAQLHDHLVRLAWAYLNGPMLPVFVDLVSVRNRVYELLDRTERLAQRRDLYLIAGQLSCLLAGTSCDLGYPQAAVEHARAAATYGELIGHASLRAYAHGQLAMFAYLGGHHRRAVDAALAGQAHAAPGSPLLRLHNLEALARSRLSDTTGALAALDNGRRARDHVTGQDEIHDLTGGMFTSTPAKHAYMAGMTYINLGQADDAAHEAATAIDLYTNGPAEQRAEGALTVSRIDLVTAYLMGHQLDAATDALAPVLALPADQRTTIVLTRLAGFHDALTRPPHAGSDYARDLTNRIEDFRANASIHQLPGR